MQIIAGNGTSNFHMRTISGGTPSAWRRLWHDGDATITANITGNVSGSSGSCTGLAATATALTGHSAGYAYADGGTSSACSGNSASATQLPPCYTSGVQTNPQVYFNNTVGLKVAMTGTPVTWADTLWINGYAGGDVPSMCALHFSRQGEARAWISTQNVAATSYGTMQEFITAANIGSQSVNYASSAGSAPANGGTSSAVSINYNNDSNSTYQVLWGSGNGVYGTGGIYCNPYIDYLYAANFQLTSDVSLKTKIQPIDIKGVDIEYKEFELKSNPGKTRYGVIAQDLIKTNPELVEEGADGMLTVSYIDLLIKEIASLNSRVEELERRNK
jgi:hypothetical protein